MPTYRHQGDVFIASMTMEEFESFGLKQRTVVSDPSIPDGIGKPRKGAVTLALGEKTGHIHIVEEEVEWYDAPSDDVDVLEKHLDFENLLAQARAMVNDVHRPKLLFSDKPIKLLHKDVNTKSLTTDHGVINLPAGVHFVVHQEEYSPAKRRWVED